MSELSIDAKVVLLATFMNPRNILTFEMVEYKPSDRMQAALDELEALSYVNRSITGVGGKVSYTITALGMLYKLDESKQRLNPELIEVQKMLIDGDPQVALPIVQPV